MGDRVVAAKFAAMNLLPVPILNGGQAILELLQWLMRRPLPPRGLKVLQVAGLIAIMVFYVYFICTAPFSWRDATATLSGP
jgi:regulator of sigma E protease